MKDTNKINIGDIWTNHFKSLKNTNNKRVGLLDRFLFYFFPIIFPALVIFGMNFKFNEDVLKLLVGSLAVFVGLMFNALVIIINIAKNDDSNNIKILVARQLVSNVSFTIILAFFTVVITLFSFIPTKYELVNIVLDYITIAMLTLFFFNFLMIMKRTYGILKEST